jgi:DNA-binding transcriptional LysR family regulator
MSLTHAGYQFLRHAHQILASVRHAREALSPGRMPSPASSISA